MTGPDLDHARAEALRRCTVLVETAVGARASGFLVAPGRVVTCARVVLDGGGAAEGGRVAEGLVVRHESGTYPVVPGNVRAEPASAEAGPFEAFPDLALLTVPAMAGSGHPVAPLAGEEAAPGTRLTALGYSAYTPTPGVHPDTLALHVVGRSGKFIRVEGAAVKPGFGGGMLVGPDGLVRGVLKDGSRHPRPPGGWYVPLAVLIAFLGPDAPDAPEAPEAPGAASVASAAPVVQAERPPDDAELVDALMAFPYTARADGRFDLLDRMGQHLGLPHSFEAEERTDRRDHLFRIVRRCRNHRDAPAALRALYTALEELAPYDGALDRLRSVVGRAAGGWESR
ncbi:trypsin-like peptidase domain-containing protein [Streptomyces sp. FH025]|uniref:effector-associated domain 2-containing protein n=1 Tax=Streptomyces sp. FH025 TaxID=2815937 RepID=UPI001A9FDC3A|nr:trypsin-like peptidase domain-containing protein [Streptomyces sp. FH025]MBO1419801.1 trypsin-like peptidase domain-containing protein [Streptomyces sp. FH025]